MALKSESVLSFKTPPQKPLTGGDRGNEGPQPEKIDLTGQRYGKLTVLVPAENVGSRTAWLCRCDCGWKTAARTNRLRSGHTASCVCLAAGRENGLPGLTYVDGTCVEMLADKTVQRNNISGVPGVDWRAL